MNTVELAISWLLPVFYNAEMKKPELRGKLCNAYYGISPTATIYVTFVSL